MTCTDCGTKLEELYTRGYSVGRPDDPLCVKCWHLAYKAAEAKLAERKE
jgi:hypothetical protein